MNARSLWTAGIAVALIVGRSWAASDDKLALQDNNPPPAQDEKVQEDNTPAPTVSDKIKDPSLRKHLLENIDIFGKSDMPAIYILAPDDPELEGLLLTRDFSRDPYFMQNIDREEFEMKTYMREFTDEDKEKEKDKDKKDQALVH